MQKKSCFILIFLMLLAPILICSLVQKTSGEDTQSNDAYDIFIQITVLDVDPSLRKAYVEILVQLRHLPFWFNETDVMVRVEGGGYITVICNETWKDTFGVSYQGKSLTSWYMSGTGEMFPFDYYILKFSASPLTSLDFTMIEPVCVFNGENHLTLTDTWQTGKTIDEPPFALVDEQVLILIQRRALIPFFRFVVPIILCYFLLASTMFIDPQRRMNERLTIYLAVFVFVPTFFFSIYSFLPHLSSLSLPELLLTNLIMSTVIFLFGSLVKEGSYVVVRRRELPMDFFAFLSALLTFLALYSFLFWGEISGLTNFPVATLNSVIATLLFPILAYYVALRGYTQRVKKKHRIKREKKKVRVLGLFKIKKRR